MAYTKTVWADNQSPDINATNLNHIEQGIYDAHTSVDSKITMPSGGSTGQVLTKTTSGTEWDDAVIIDATLSHEGQAADAKAVGDAITSASEDTADALNTKATVIEESASGNPATFNDGADGIPVKSLKVGIEPVQNLNGYDHPWVGGAGANKFDISKVSDSGSYTFVDGVGTVASGYGASGRLIPYTEGISVTSGAEITISADVRMTQTGTDERHVIAMGCKNSSTNGSYTKQDIALSAFGTWERVSATVTAPADAIWIGIQPRYLENSIEFKNVQVEIGNTATAYAPYENICPITGHTSATVTRTGKNLLDINNTILTQRVTFTGTPQYFTLTATGTYCYYQIEIPCKANQPVTVRFDGSSTGDNRRVFISHLDYYGNSYKIFYLTETLTNCTYTFTPTEDVFRMMFYVTATATTGEMVIKNLQAEYGETATEYEPFVSTSYPYSLGQSVYGGTLDVLTGVLTVDRAKAVFSGSETWNLIGTNFFYTYKQPDFALKTGTYMTENGITIYWYNDSNQIRVSWYDNPFLTTESNMNELLPNGMGVLYELATPTTVQLTAQQVTSLLGVNHISADCGDVEVVYRADTKLYIDKQIAEHTKATRNIIAGVEVSNTATKNYSVNDMLIVGDDLYKVTHAIANGGTVTVGSNVVKTTVAEQLIALMNA